MLSENNKSSSMQLSEVEVSPLRTESMLRIQGRRRTDSRASGKRSTLNAMDSHILQQQIKAQPRQLLAVQDSLGVYKFPTSIVFLDFRDADLERDFRTQFDDESTSVFRAWAVLFLLFHVATFLVFDRSEHSTADLVRTVRYARIPSVALATVSYMISYLPDWDKLPKQEFFAMSLIAQVVFLLFVTFSTLDNDASIALPNATIAAVIVGYTSYRMRMPWAMLVGWSAQIIATCCFLYARLTHAGNLDWRCLYFNIPMLVFNVLGMMTCYQVERTERENFHHARQFLTESAITKYETDRGEYIIFNILPRRVVQRLKTQPTIAERFDDVTVMFVCIENLISIADFKETRKAVQFMNDLFEVCDKRAEQFGVEKVKTINDKYMCVSGAPDQSKGHAAAMCDMALAVWKDFDDMQSGTRQFTYRAGISSGPIVAGVIGLQKFCWDIWGDTVNTAARMEYPKGGSKLSGSVRLSEMTYLKVRATHECESLGGLEVKGKGTLETYRLVGRLGGMVQVGKAGSAADEDEEEEDIDDEDVAQIISQQVAIMNKSTRQVQAASRQLRVSPINEEEEEEENGEEKGFIAAEEEEEEKKSALLTLPVSVAPIRIHRGARKARRRSSVMRASIPPELDIEGFVATAEFEIPQWKDMDASQQSAFFDARFAHNKTIKPTLAFSILMAIALWALMGVMDASLSKGALSDINQGVFLARYAVVVPIWIVHLFLSNADWYDRTASSGLGLVSIIAMVVASRYITMKLEDGDGRNLEKGGEYYAPLPIVFAIYLGYSVFAMSLRWLSYTIASSYTVLFAIEIFLTDTSTSFTPLEERSYFFVWLTGLSLFGVFVAHTLEGLSFAQWNIVESARKQKSVMQNKYAEADALLKNIVPREVIPALTSFTDTSGVARKHENISILFSDIAGFTNLSKDLTPRKLVNWLNQFFTTFDNHAKAHGVEKIKTIGDAYIACAGLVERREDKDDYANDLVDMAIALQDVLNKRNAEIAAGNGKVGKLPVTLRIGVHTGTVLAGIIGKRKFQYDMFGRSVVIAEEMESSGRVGAVHISQACKEALIRADFTYNFEQGEPCHATNDQGENYDFDTFFVTRTSKNSQLVGKLSKVLGDDFNKL